MLTYIPGLQMKFSNWNLFSLNSQKTNIVLGTLKEPSQLNACVSIIGEGNIHTFTLTSFPGLSIYPDTTSRHLYTCILNYSWILDFFSMTIFINEVYFIVMCDIGFLFLGYTRGIV